jgi:hypothetical protein
LWLKKTRVIDPAPSPTVTSVIVPWRCRMRRVFTLLTWARIVTRSPFCRSSSRAISPRLA